jgi:hypothetical protein
MSTFVTNARLQDKDCFDGLDGLWLAHFQSGWRVSQAERPNRRALKKR